MRIINKYKQFIYGCLITLGISLLILNGLDNIINIYLYPIIIALFFILYGEHRNKQLVFYNEISKIKKYFDKYYYMSNDCYNGCQVYYDIKDFIETFQCDNDISKLNNEILDKIKLFFNIFGDDIKKINLQTNSIENDENRDESNMILSNKVFFYKNLLEIKLLINKL